jgi:hypothetical protein
MSFMKTLSMSVHKQQIFNRLIEMLSQSLLVESIVTNVTAGRSN